MSRIFRRVEINRRRRRRASLKDLRERYAKASDAQKKTLWVKVQKIAPYLALDNFLLKK